MKRMEVLALTIAVVGFLFAISHANPVGKSASRSDQSPETVFFHQNLTDVERLWFMNSSLVLYLEEHDEYQKPGPVKPKSMDIPASLIPRLLNGGVPENFQARFTEHVIETYGLTTEHIKALVQGYEACGQYECIQIPSLGEACCPWG